MCSKPIYKEFGDLVDCTDIVGRQVIDFHEVVLIIGCIRNPAL